MSWFSKPTDADRQAFVILADGLEALAKTLPAAVDHIFHRSLESVELEIPAPTNAHRRLLISGAIGSFEYELGSIWSEPSPLTTEGAVELLAVCTAVVSGAVREVQDRRTGILYHIYRLKSHGLDRFARDSEYSLLHHLRLKVRKVRIHRLPPLAA